MASILQVCFKKILRSASFAAKKAALALILLLLSCHTFEKTAISHDLAVLLIWKATHVVLPRIHIDNSTAWVIRMKDNFLLTGWVIGDKSRHMKTVKRVSFNLIDCSWLISFLRLKIRAIGIHWWLFQVKELGSSCMCIGFLWIDDR